MLIDVFATGAKKATTPRINPSMIPCGARAMTAVITAAIHENPMTITDGPRAACSRAATAAPSSPPALKHAIISPISPAPTCASPATARMMMASALNIRLETTTQISVARITRSASTQRKPSSSPPSSSSSSSSSRSNSPPSVAPACSRPRGRRRNSSVTKETR
nr:hypothetical protein [uncultured bacterium]